MTVKLNLRARLGVTAGIIVMLAVIGIRHESVGAQAAKRAPIFEVDPLWPKPLPNHWVTGSTIGLSVDMQDNVWTIHRPNTVEDNFKAADIMVGDARGRDDEARPGAAAAPPPSTPVPIGACCKVAPPVLVYDQAGNMVKSWGGPGKGYDWPDSNHGITVDHRGNVWLAGNGNKDTQILKFDGAGHFLFQIGTHGVHNGSNDTENFWEPTKIWEDVPGNEMYIGDGYGNRRVIVLDEDTGHYKRHWGAYGNKPSDERVPAYNPKSAPSKQFNTVHCAIVSNDGFVYVCDRVNDRIQVFHKDGSFVREWIYLKNTLGAGSTWDLALWPDKAQRFLLNADGTNQQIRILRRSDGTVVGSFGRSGRMAGQFHWVHSIAVDSHGNVFTTEVDNGKRIQKFRVVSGAPARDR